MKHKYIYFKEEDMYIGYFEEYPDYRTQGASIQELEENLKDIYNELISDNIPNVYHVAELEIWWNGGN